MDYKDYFANHDQVYELTRNGFKIALEIDKDFEFNDENKKLLKLFAFVIMSDANFYDSIKDSYDAIYIPNS